MSSSFQIPEIHTETRAKSRRQEEPQIAEQDFQRTLKIMIYQTKRIMQIPRVFLSRSKQHK